MKRITIGFLLASFFAAALADVVELKNGDRLSGKIEGLSKGKLTFSTDYAGKIQIDWKKVAKLSSEERMVAEFTSGRSALGVIQSPRNGTAWVAAEQPQSVDLAEIVSIRQDPTLAEKRGLLHDWRGSVDFGYSVTAGNTEVKNFALNFTPERRTEADRIQLKLQHLKPRDHGVRRIGKAEVIACAKSIQKQIFSRQGPAYLRFLWKVIDACPGMLPEAIRLAIMGYHFEKITRELIAVHNFREYLETELDRFRERFSSVLEARPHGLSDVRVYVQDLSSRVCREYEQIHEDFRYAVQDALDSFRKSLSLQAEKKTFDP